MKRKFALVAALLVGLSFAACGGDEKPGANKPGRAALVAVVTVKAGDWVTVPVAFTNPSDGVVRYPWQGGTLVLLSGALYQNGKLLDDGITVQGQRLTKDHVKDLKPGETLKFRYTLLYLTVKPGEYELRLKYEIPPQVGL